MKEHICINAKQNKGITLIALITTIAVLMILIVVTVSGISSNNGVIDKEKENQSEFAITQEKEKLQKEVLEWKLISVNGVPTLKSYLDNIYGAENVTLNSDNTLTVTVQSGNKYIVTVDGDVTYLGANMYEPEQSNISITLDKTSITKEITHGKSETETIKATLNNAKGTLTWLSSNPDVARIVTSEGNTRKIELKKAGTATITVLYADNTNIGATCNITVTEKRVSSVWTQNKTIVTNGEVTLEVGQTVTGYEAGDDSYTGGWAVLGAENGKLLLVSKVNVGTLSLSGKDGYYNGISQLNEMCSSYLNSSLADEARSIKVEDINRVTGYNPESTGDGTRFGAGYPYQYGNTVTYTMNSKGKVVYTSKVATGANASGTSSETSFEHVDGTVLTTSNSIDVTSNSYFYYPNTLTTSSTGTTNGIETTSDAYKVLFKQAGGTAKDYYWLASQYQGPAAGAAGFGLRRVYGKHIRDSYLWGSCDGASGGSGGVRAVVSVKSEAIVTSDGEISI